MAKKKGTVSQFDVKKKNKRLSWGRLLIFAVIILTIAYFIVSGIKIIRLNAEKEEAQARQEELLRIKEDLTAEYENINSAQYIERLARKNLKLVKSNELLFILPESTEGQAEDESEADSGIDSDTEDENTKDTEDNNKKDS